MHPKNPQKKLPPGKHSPPDKVYEAESPKGRVDHDEEVQFQAYAQRFSGPLPHPDTLRAYDSIVPGAAREIIQSFVKEGDSRRALQERETAMCETWAREDITLQKRGQILGFIIAVIGVGGGLAVAATVSPAAGASVSGVTLLGIVAAFLRQRHMTPTEAPEDKTPES